MKKILLSGLLASSLFADFTLEYQMQDNTKQVVQYKDAQHVLIKTTRNGTSDGGEQLIVGDKHYMVMNEGGKTKYMDMDVMVERMKQMSAAFGGMPQDEAKKMSRPAFKIIKKGAKKTVAGIKGEVWRIEFEEEGHKEQIDMLVTDDKHFVDAIHNYVKAIGHFSKMGDEENNDMSEMFNIADGYVAMEFEGMKLLKFDEKSVPDSVFSLPVGMDMGKKMDRKGATVTKPPLCPIVGMHGASQQLSKMLKKSANGWNLIEDATCINMMKMRAENAIYKKGDAYIHINLSINVDGENGMIAKYRTSNMKVSNLEQGKIQGHRYQLGLLERVGQNAMDIKLPNAMLSLTATKNVKDNLATFAKSVFDLSQFIPVKKSKPTADDALKSLGAMFGGQGGGQAGKAPSDDADMQKAGEMLKGLFGQ